MALKCCSKARVKAKKVAYAKAMKATKVDLGPEGRFSSKAPKKKAHAKKADAKSAKPCRVCGKK